MYGLVNILTLFKSKWQEKADITFPALPNDDTVSVKPEKLTVKSWL